MAGDLGRCLSCDHLWQGVSKAAPTAPVAPATAPVAPVVPVGRSARMSTGGAPSGVRVRREGDEVIVRLPWRDHIHPAWKLILLAVTFLLVGSVIQNILIDWYDTQAELVFDVLCALVPAALSAYYFLNTSELRIRPDSVEVRHGPLWSPQDRNRSLSAKHLGMLEVRTVRVERHGRYGSRHTNTYYSLAARNDVLLRKFNEQAPIAHVARLMQQTLDSQPTIRFTGPSGSTEYVEHADGRQEESNW
jgi:hypothetical protein